MLTKHDERKMPKNLGHIESLARSYTDTAIKTLAGIMMEQTTPPMARIVAAKVLLDRGWGKPKDMHHSEIDDNKTAIKTLAGIMMEQTSPPMARIVRPRFCLIAAGASQRTCITARLTTTRRCSRSSTRSCMCMKPCDRQGARPHGSTDSTGGCRRGDRIAMCFGAVHESAFGTKRTCPSRRSMSAFGGKADIAQR